MATTSALKAMHDLHSIINDPPGGWSTNEAAVEVLKNALATGATGFATEATLLLIAALALQPTRFSNLGANATLNVKSSAGSVFSCVCINTNASVRYLQLHNTATVPTDQGVPVYSFPVPPSGYGIGLGTDIFTNAGVAFATGIAFAFSTTANTYTAGTAAEQTTIIHYR